MIRKKLFFTCIAALTAGLLLSGCSKDGKIGPEGPQGNAGPAGPAGTANVVYSSWITLPKPVIVDNFKYFDIPAPELTNNIINSGAVLTFLGVDNSTAFPLPFTEVVPGGANSYFVSASAPEKKITLHVRWVGTTLPSDWLTSQFNVKFRYVIIPGGVKTSATVNLNNYNEVKEYFKIPQ